MKTTKIIMIFVCLVMVFGIWCLSYGQEEKEVLKSYEAVTGKCEVETREEVVVEEVTIVERRVTWTLAEIETTINYYKYHAEQAKATLDEANAAIKAMEELKAKIEKEVDSVELKPLAGVNM